MKNESNSAVRSDMKTKFETPKKARENRFGLAGNEQKRSHCSAEFMDRLIES
jgi:hypothetical protein